MRFYQGQGRAFPEFSFLREAVADKKNADSLSDGRGPYFYESPDYDVGILVCGNAYCPDMSSEWPYTDEVSVSYYTLAIDREQRILNDLHIYGLSPDHAVCIAEGLAETYVLSGKDAFLREVQRLPFRKGKS